MRKLKVGRASRLPGRQSRQWKVLRARGCALAGQAGRLPYVPGLGPFHEPEGAAGILPAEESLPTRRRQHLVGVRAIRIIIARDGSAMVMARRAIQFPNGQTRLAWPAPI